jgi:predicted dehydrogenase
MGEWHAESYKKLKNAELVAVCDKDAGWAEHIRAKYEAPHAFSDYREMLEMKDLDAVSVAVPTFLHLPIAEAAFAAGKHVLMEKPMAMNAAEGEKMLAAAKKAGKTLMPSLNQRFDADVQYLKRYVGEGHLGEIYFARTLWRRPLGGLPDPTADRPTGVYTGRNWFNELSKGGGVMRDLGAHVIDVALWLMGFPEVQDVSGCAYNKFLPEYLKGMGYTGDADDHAVGFVRFKTGASLQFEVSFGQHIDHDEVVTELFGSKGGVLRWSGRPPKLYGMAGGAYSTTEPRLQEKRKSAQAEFVDAVLENREPLVTPEQGIRVMRIMDAVYAGGVR